jgi:hypothetical protein
VAACFTSFVRGSAHQTTVSVISEDEHPLKRCLNGGLQSRLISLLAVIPRWASFRSDTERKSGARSNWEAGE